VTSITRNAYNSYPVTTLSAACTTLEKWLNNYPLSKGASYQKTLEVTRTQLLPEDKAAHVERLKAAGHRLAFVGDGVNDASVVALAGVGIAMGGLSSDATIETADVVIHTDHPRKIATARRIAVATHTVVGQNIWLASAIKAVVLALGAGDRATMWEAVFADVGGALLATPNAVRIQRMKF